VLTFASMFMVLMFWGGLIFLPIAIVKLLLPFPAAQRRLGGVLSWIAGDAWVGSNKLLFTLLHGPRTEQTFSRELDPRRSWLLICNHQSWADILILFDAFWRRAPLPRFFLKKELIWVPLVGFICWALDMPFTKRHSKAALKANPALARDDLETTRRFCSKYKRQVTSVVNFVEGTRSTSRKRAASGSPYAHLLKPKCGGLYFTLDAMGDQFAGIVDVTIDYQPSARAPIWSFLCGEQSGVLVQARVLPVPAAFLREEPRTAQDRAALQQWINDLWAEKDAALSRRRRLVPQPTMERAELS